MHVERESKLDKDSVYFIIYAHSLLYDRFMMYIAFSTSIDSSVFCHSLLINMNSNMDY